MRFGIFPKEGGSFDGMLEETTTAEEIGFDSCWVCEHHVGGENYWPAPLTRLAGIATTTDSLDLVPAVLVLPLHNALEVAEKAAVLDQMSDGRLKLGVGLGYIQAEFDAYGIPMEERAGRLIEGLRLLDTYLSGTDTVSFESPFWSSEDLPVNPTTVQSPRPPLWVGGWGDKAIERAVKFGDGWMPGGTANLDQLATRREKMATVAEEVGKSIDDLVCPLMREVIVAETHEEAIELGEQYLHRTYLEEYGSDDWSHPLIKETEMTVFERLADDRFIIGSPTEITEQLERFRDRIDVEHVGCRFHHPGMSHEQVQTQIELFGDEVIPELT